MGGGGGGERGKEEMGRKGGVVYGVVRLVKVQLLEKPDSLTHHSGTAPHQKRPDTLRLHYTRVLSLRSRHWSNQIPH